MMPRRVRIAILIAFLCHGLFILAARYRMSYDAYTHMLFANHYAGNWFSLWETRWYTGFTVVSYPPLTHQLIALFVPMLGFDRAFALVLWVVTTLYPLGIYAFSRIFTGKPSASYAALASAILLPIYVTAHIFGQLPFLVSTLVALFSAAGVNRFLHEGGIHNFTLSVALIATSMAMHHATLMVQPFLIVAVIANVFFRHRVTETTGKVNFKFRVPVFSWLKILRRSTTLIASATIACILVIWPFWQWGADQTIQTPIDHLSRHNFFTDPLALAIFFFPLYGPLVAVIPFLFRKWHRRFSGLIISFVVLFLLGLGGTTPLPRLFFGDAWEWLTYDRFAFWACLTLTPFFGILFILLKRRWKYRRLILKPIPVTLRRTFLPILTFSIFAVTALGSWLTPFLFPIQPEAIDMQPIVDFLNEGDHAQWRYLTFGFGDQFAYLNLLTTATTIDGSYHTARTLPELRESGIGQVDTSYWALKGIPAIEPILKKSGEHGVRWGFVNRKEFIPTLKKNGWTFVKYTKNGIQVWENPKAVMPGPSAAPATPPITAFSWGVFPLLTLVTASALGTLRIWPVQAEKVIRHIYSFLIGLIPIALCFWIYRIIGEFTHPRVYFIYTDALFFLTDALVLLAVILWLSVKIAQLPLTNYQFRLHPSSFTLLLAALFFLTTLSILWSRDWRTSLYISLHFWLIFLLILSLRDWHEAWKFAMIGLCAALGVQIIAGFIEFAQQSTAFLAPLNTQWPGILDPSIRGASVVQLADGLRVLRAYGTLPHPNILGGFILVSLLGPASLFLAKEKINNFALTLFSLGIILIGLTFSRSAWLGLIAFFITLIMKSKHLDRRKLFLLVATTIVTIALTLYPLRDLVFTRVSNSPVATEQLSTFGREWLTQQAFEMMRKHPLTGVGIGSFNIELSTYAVEGAIIEPVHNILLLAGSELGIVGLLLVIGMFFSIAMKIIKARTPKAILVSAVITGLGVISLFDHYLWTLAPGRIMLGLALGLWLGQIHHDA